MEYRICLVDGCEHYVPPQHEVDIGVGLLTSSERPICEDCLNSKDPDIIAQIEEIECENKDFPF